MSSIRTELTPSQRSMLLQHHIDPGFVHYRKIQSLLGDDLMKCINNSIKQLPDLPDFQKKVQIDHIYTKYMLAFCEELKLKTLGELISSGSGEIFCSTERLAPCPDIYKSERAISVWQPYYETDYRVEFHYTTSLITSSTLKSCLCEGEDKISIIAELRGKKENTLIFHPLIMGFPWLLEGQTKPDFDIM